MLGKTILPTDEELGKKDDDHKPGAHGRRPAWTFSVAALRWRRRRVLLAAIGLYLVYFVLKNTSILGDFMMPAVSWDGAISPTPEYDEEPTGAPPGLESRRGGTSPSREFDGPIKFYRLAESLHQASYTNGYSQVNRNVLFAVSSLQSASTLIPMACEMAKWNRNHVHAAFMGREDIPLPDLLEMNGVDKEACPAIWHDARPDYMEYSSDTRAELSVKSAMMHIHSFLHPQVAITDDPSSEDVFFVQAMRAKVKSYGMPLIEIPKGRLQSFMWITRLDAGSLRNWHRPTVEVLIQAPSDSSGGILRLLRSLRSADYSGLTPPRLTIELPADADGWVSEYLKTFDWPPANSDSLQTANQLIIRRRIANEPATQEDSAVRFLESFYPTSTANSHVLVLSPNAEVSPLYYHYLKYTLLEYKYSSYGAHDSANVMGISLERPSVLLDGKTKLSLPHPSDMHTSRYSQLFPDVSSTQFLWQAPNSHGALVFGEKWAEFHSFIGNRVSKQHRAPKTAPRPKLVSENLPAWMEYMLELMQARGYSFLYPATSSSESLVTMHNELYQPPEEFVHKAQSSEEQVASDPPRTPDEPFLRAETPPPLPSSPEPAVIPYSRLLHAALPFDGDLPEIQHLPYLSTNGDMIAPRNASTRASAYAEKFRTTVGGCRTLEGKHRKVEAGSAKDLFCFGDEDEEDWENDKVSASSADSYFGEDDSATSASLKPSTSAVMDGTTTAAAAPTSDWLYSPDS